MFGLSIDNLRDIKNCFVQFPQINKALLYGSRAKGNYKSGSDIDITLIGKNLNLSNTIYPLQGKLDKLYLPYQFDISIFDKLDNPAFIDHILRVGKTLYQKPQTYPKHWQVKPLGEVCEVIAGQSPAGKYYNSEGNGVPFYQGKKEFTDKYIGKPTKWTTSTTKTAIKDDILMSVRAPVGPVNFATQNICIGRGLAAIRTSSLIDKEFLYNLLVNYESQITGNTGAVFNSINKAQIENIKIPIPPLAEQQAIVKKLDALFSQIKQAKSQLEQNLQNAKDLWQSSLNQVFNNPDNDWQVKPLGEVCENLDRKRIPITKNKRTKGFIPYYGASGVVDYISEYIFDEDLLLVSEDGANLLARTYPIAFSVKGKSWVNNHAHVLRFKDLERQFFLEYYLNSISLEDYISGMAQPKLNQRKLNSILIPNPSLEVKQAIVKKLDAINQQTQQLTQNTQNQLKSLETLEKSLLEKAFYGELI